MRWHRATRELGVRRVEEAVEQSQADHGSPTRVAERRRLVLERHYRVPLDRRQSEGEQPSPVTVRGENVGDLPQATYLTFQDRKRRRTR
ncbi:Uncharacterised protein [Mycobacteroides abscessus subsp. abscessus]|nr:Uncharacterised protein [Mycobacteroides abscessus subsp. abscessus]